MLCLVSVLIELEDCVANRTLSEAILLTQFMTPYTEDNPTLIVQFLQPKSGHNSFMSDTFHCMVLVKELEPYNEMWHL